MNRCQKCGFEIAEGNLYCGRCGSVAAGKAEAATRTIETPASRSTTASGDLDEGRFPAGTVLAQRYRIVSLLGRGGMGEVYRANDLLLGQPVALKFLPPALAQDEGAASRFRNEVKTARQVTHPNVCRVHDIGEHDGQLYLSMEFVDGEDLSSLLRRIGRLPEDKGLEIAHKLCSGLAAAHEKGVIHRDLKPANIMLDGRGQVVITDFGLAGFSEGIKDVWSGTPAYMAPEQKAGREVTARSDLYSLGLVLHELFTGKRPEASGASEAINPAIARVIAARLEQEPGARPASAQAVARALPGGDPLAAVLAAGETPSPELVAASGKQGGLRPAVAVALLAVAMAGVLFKAWVTGRNVLEQQVASEPPEILVQNSRELIQKWSPSITPANEIYGLSLDKEYLKAVDGLLARGSAAPRDILWSPHTFWYRSAPVPHGLLRTTSDAGLSTSDPPLTLPGMALVIMDARGRLREFETLPVKEKNSAGGPPDWEPLLTAAGIAKDRLTLERPSPGVNPVWTYKGRDGLVYRVEGESYDGKVKRFSVRNQPEPFPADTPMWLLFLVVIGFAVLFAIRNFRNGRADVQGASILALAVFLLASGHRLLSELDPVHWNMQITPLDAIAGSLLAGLIYGCAYMAMEPFLRRRWPQILVAWTRLLHGAWRDAAVGRDILVGFAGFAVVSTTLGALSLWNLIPPSFVVRSHQDFVSARSVLGLLLLAPALAIARSVFATFLMFLLRLVLRRDWLAGLAATLLVALSLLGSWSWFAAPVVVAAVIIAATDFVILIRFGFLAFVACQLAVVAGGLITTLSPSVWFAGYSFAGLAAFTLLALAAFRTSLGEQKLLSEEI